MPKRAVWIEISQAVHDEIYFNRITIADGLQVVSVHKDVTRDRVLLRLEGTQLPECCELPKPGQEYCHGHYEIEEKGSARVLTLLWPAEEKSP